MGLVLLASHAVAFAGTPLYFVERSHEAGLDVEHGYADPFAGTITRRVAGGVAVGDYDRDGWIDLFVELGDARPDRLFRNRGDGSFEDCTAAAGLLEPATAGSGPLFLDFDADGWPDLFAGGIEGQPPRLYRNLGDGRFEDITAGSGLEGLYSSVSASAGDIDGDGHLDLFVSHWGNAGRECYLWRGSGDGRFSCADAEAGLPWLGGHMDFSFTANFCDIDGDRDQDLLVTADFGLTRAWRNIGAGRLVALPAESFTDENVMGAALGDYDNDGDLDWFVTSIFDGDGVAEGDWGTTGNRLYRNRGDGSFEDHSLPAGARDGSWGWGASFADLDNDGHLDLVHVNGWPQGSPQFRGDRSRIFLADGAGGFVESGRALDFADSLQGRGVSCLDYDRDGDLDILVANHRGPLRLYRNEGGSTLQHLVVRPVAEPGHALAGTRVLVRTPSGAQLRELRFGSNYASQDPAEAHFGLGHSRSADVVEVAWPDGRRSVLTDVPAGQLLDVEQALATRPAAGAPAIGLAPNPSRGTTTISLEWPVGLAPTLQLFDLAGRLVRELPPQPRAGAFATYVWDGRDRSGSPVADGSYFARPRGVAGAPTGRILRSR